MSRQHKIFILLKPAVKMDSRAIVKHLLGRHLVWTCYEESWQELNEWIAVDAHCFALKDWDTCIFPHILGRWSRLEWWPWITTFHPQLIPEKLELMLWYVALVSSTLSRSRRLTWLESNNSDSIEHSASRSSSGVSEGLGLHHATREGLQQRQSSR